MVATYVVAPLSVAGAASDVPPTTESTVPGGGESGGNASRSHEYRFDVDRRISQQSWCLPLGGRLLISWF